MQTSFVMCSQGMIIKSNRIWVGIHSVNQLSSGPKINLYMYMFQQMSLFFILKLWKAEYQVVIVESLCALNVVVS